MNLIQRKMFCDKHNKYDNSKFSDKLSSSFEFDTNYQKLISPVFYINLIKY